MNANYPQYTKQQLANYLFNGDVNIQHNPNDAVADMQAFASRVVDYAIQHNPTYVYNQIIKRNWGSSFPNYGKGLEFNTSSQESMKKFLLGIYSKVPANMQQAWVVKMLTEVPKNPKINNWTVPTN